MRSRAAAARFERRERRRPRARLGVVPFAQLGRELQQPGQAVRALERLATRAVRGTPPRRRCSSGVRLVASAARALRRRALRETCAPGAPAASARAPPSASRSSRRTPGVSSRGGCTSASEFSTCAILFGYSLWTQARARSARRVAAGSGSVSADAVPTKQQSVAAEEAMPHLFRSSFFQYFVPAMSAEAISPFSVI